LPVTEATSAVLEITLLRESGGIPGYLSPLYLADEEAYEEVHWLWDLTSGPSRATMIGLQTLMVIGIATVWLARRHDPIFGWLFLLSAGSLAYTLAGSSFPAYVSAGHPYFVLALSSFGPMVVGLAMSVVGMPRPAWLKACVVALPLVLAVGFALDALPHFAVALSSAFIGIGGHLAAGGVLARNALRTRAWDQALRAAPFLPARWYGVRD